MTFLHSPVRKDRALVVDMELAVAARLAAEGEITLVTAHGGVWLQAGQTGQAPGHSVGDWTKGRSLLSDDELGGEDVPGSHHVSPDLGTVLHLEGETRVIVAMLAQAVITTHEQVTIITLPRSFIRAQKTSAHFVTTHYSSH